MRRILYFDDEDEYVSTLEEEHGETYQIVHKDDIGQLKNLLDKLEGTKEWPDLLLLDVYWPKTKKLDSEVQSVRDETQKALKGRVEPEIHNLNEVYTKMFTPIVVDKWLEIVRKKYGPEKLPIVLYSSKGHFLLYDDDWLSKAIKYNVDWIFKGVASSQVEDAVFERAIQNSKRMNLRFADMLKNRRFLFSMVCNAVISFLVGLLTGVIF